MEGATLPKWSIRKRKEPTPQTSAPPPQQPTEDVPHPILEYTETLIAEDRRGTPPKPEPAKTWKRASWEPPEAIETQVDRIAVKQKATTTRPATTRHTMIDRLVDQVIEKKKKPRA